jgi:putative ABC transport system permease protein
VNPLRRKLTREIGRRRGQFGAIVVMAVLGTTLFGASLDAYRNLLASYDQVFVELGMADFTFVGTPATAQAQVAALAGVGSTAERTVADSAMRVNGKTVAVHLIGYPLADQPAPALNRVRAISGSTPASSTEVAVEKHLAEAYGLGQGSQIEVALADGWRALTVSGDVVSPEYLWPARSRQEILVPSDEWGVLYVPPAVVADAPAAASTTELLVGYAAGADRAALDAQLHGMAASLGAVDAYDRAGQPSNAALHEDINGFGEMSIMFPVLFLGAAGLAVYILLGRLVRSQRAEIGVLLALGLSRRRVINHYLSFGLLATSIGALLGAVLGVLLGGLVTELYTSELGIPARVINVYPETPLIGVLVGLLAGLLGALVPALRAARVTPAEAMRGASTGIGHASLLERVLPPLRRLPSRWKLVIRGIGRSRARSLATIVGIILSVTLVLTSWGLLDTVQVLVERQFGQIERQSLDAATLAPVDAQQLAAARALNGVAAAEAVARVPVALSTATGSYGTVLVGFQADTQMHDFLAADGSSQPLPANGLLLGAALQSRLGVDVGDAVSLSVSGASPVTATVAGFVHEPLGTYAYGSLDYLSAELGTTTVTDATRSIMVSLTSDAAKTSVEQALGSLPGVISVTNSDSLRELLNQYMGLFYVFVGAMFALGALLAFALIYATISANVSERTVELTNLRAAGMTIGEVGRTITAENLLLTALGVVPGLVVGYVSAAVFMAAFSSDLFAFDLQVRPLSFVAAALAVFVAVGLSLLPALRAVSRVDLGVVVRERAT